MSRYDRIYSIFARRAVSQASIDLQSFIDQGIEAGMGEDAIQRLLLEDLDESGPIFGKFFRSLTGAAEKSVMSATRQADRVATIQVKAERARLMELANGSGSALDDADPEAMDLIEQAESQRQDLYWMAELLNTCHRCLPLHGTRRTAEEWQELGLHPDTIHADWTSGCHCKLVPAEQVDRSEEMQPLMRNRVQSATGLKGSRKTARSVAQVDLDRSLAARDKALDSIEGRRTLRLLGMSKQEALDVGKPKGQRAKAGTEEG